MAFLRSAAGQAVLVRQGFRGNDGRGGSPAAGGMQRLPPPTPQQREELLRFWQQAG